MGNSLVKKIAILGLLFCGLAYAEDGLVVHFTVKKLAGNETSTVSNGVLMRLTETTTQTFPGQYEMRLDSKAGKDGEINLMVVLKDLSSGKPIYAGSAGTTLKVGGSQTLSFHQLSSSAVTYDVFVDTAYGKLP